LIENREAETVSLQKIDFQNDPQARPYNIFDFTETADGSIWAANSFSMVRFLPDGRFVNYEVPRLTTRDEAYAIESDPEGRIWYSHVTGVFVFRPEPLEELAGLENRAVIRLPAEEIDLEIGGTLDFPADSKKMLRLVGRDLENETARKGNKFGSPMVEDLYRSSDGKIWMPARKSLYFFEGGKYQSLQDSNALLGLAKEMIEDREGNLWLGTFSGAFKYRRNGLISYNEVNGLPDPVIHLISETPAGEALALHGNWQVSRRTENGFRSVQLNMPESARFSWTSFPVFADRTGGLWVLTLKGLFRFSPTANFSALAGAVPEMVVSNDFPLKDKPFYRAFSGSDRSIWFSVRGGAGNAGDNELYKYHLESGRWEKFSDLEGYPKGAAVVSFAEDRAGNRWFGFYGRGGLFKFANNRFTEFTTADGVPPGSVFALQVDRRDRLWLGAAGWRESTIRRPKNRNLSVLPKRKGFPPVMSAVWRKARTAICTPERFAA
jgi:ligand-binding sensor domain-containing protein